MKENPNYYAVIPSPVLFHPTLSSTEKLLFGVVSSLTNQYGHCFASNEYLGNLLDISADRASRCLAVLKREKFIRIDIERHDNGTTRTIHLNHVAARMAKTTGGVVKNNDTGMVKTPTRVVENNKYNIHSNNIQRDNKQKRARKNEETEPPHHITNRVLVYFNEAAQTDFTPGKANKLIYDLLQAGRTEQDFYDVIDLKVWQSEQLRKNGQPVFDRQWLTPFTIFKPDNFEKYIHHVREIKAGKSEANAFASKRQSRQKRVAAAFKEAGLDAFAMLGFKESSEEN